MEIRVQIVAIRWAKNIITVQTAAINYKKGAVSDDTAPFLSTSNAGNH